MSAATIYQSANQGLSGANSSSEVWVSEPQPLVYKNSKNNKKFSIVFEPSSGKTYVVERTYAAGFLLQKADLSKSIATSNTDGSWTPTAYGSQDTDLKNAIRNDKNIQTTFTDSTKRTIISAYSQKNDGAIPTQNQINQIKSGINTTNEGNGEEENPDPSADNPDQPGITRENIIKENTALNTTLTNLSTLTEAIEANSARSRSAELRGLSYPEKFPEGMDYIIFEAKEYGTKTFNSQTFGFGKRNNNVSINESVKLPIQPSISDSNSVGWNEQTFNPAQVVGANLAIGGITGGIEGFIRTLDSNITAAQTNPQDISSAIVAYFTQQATGAQILPKIGGAVFNQNTELLFQGPQLRPFNFTFKLSPRSDTEAEKVKKIIGFFKRNMAAKTTQSELYLKSPNVFGITYYLNGKKNHSGINLIKDCALQSCTVNYTPEGSYMAYQDGAMTSYEITLQFMELEPIYASDYDDSNAGSHSIGY